MLLGIVLDQPEASRLVEIALSEGLLVNAPAKDVIRIAPALTISEKDVRLFIKKFTSIVDAL